jgi:restriction endonuclease S subunit
MITYSIIQKSQLERGYRLDAEYYQPEYLEVARKVKSLHHETLEDISESIVSFGAYALTNFIEWQDDGIPFIVAENIKEGFISYEGVRYISDKTDEILKKSRIQEEQVLLSMSGSVGNAAVAYKIPPKLNSNQDIVKIKLKGKFSPYSLAAFLNSKYGRMQVLRLPVGSVQQHIFIWQTKSLLVPIFPESFINSIDKIYKEGLDQLQISKSLYSQAEDLLLKELGLKDFKATEELSFIVNLSDVKSAHRVDAEYFQPKYDKLISKLRNVKKLPNATENVPARYNPVDQSDKIFKYVELANIDSSIGVIDGFSEVLGQEAPSRAKRLLKTGDVIVSSLQGSLAKVALVNREQDGFLASTGFFQFRSKEILPEVLLVFAKSPILQMQLEKQCAGTILTAVPKEGIKNIIIPALSKPLQQKIADVVRQSHEARNKSKELLGKAKREVEQFIEDKKHQR